jgi:hypothetical protein
MNDEESSSSDDDNHDGICTCASCGGGIISPRSIKLIDVCFTSLIDLWTANNASAIQSGGPAVQYAYHPNAACTKVLPPPPARRLEAETDLRQTHLDAFIAVHDDLSAEVAEEANEEAAYISGEAQAYKSRQVQEADEIEE